MKLYKNNFFGPSKYKNNTYIKFTKKGLTFIFCMNSKNIISISSVIYNYRKYTNIMFNLYIKLNKFIY